MNKIASCHVTVISNPTVCNICVFHAVVFGDIKIIFDAGISLFVFSKAKFDLKLC